jgi:Uma2 family endonuclease
MQNRRRTTAERFLVLASRLGPSELVAGEVRTMSPAGYRHGLVAQRLSQRLNAYVSRYGLGFVPTAETGFVIRRNPDTVRAPDVAFVSKSRHARVGATDAFFPGPPDLAAEVRSPEDRLGKVRGKVRSWLAAGCRLVWVIDPKRRSATVYRPGRPSQEIAADGELTGGTVVRGFRVPLAELFDF